MSQCGYVFIPLLGEEKEDPSWSCDKEATHTCCDYGGEVCVDHKCRCSKPLKSNKKLFLVTREDLPPGQQAVQAAHALREFSEHHPEVDRRWYQSSNYLALLATKDENALRALMLEARYRDVPTSGFHEPDRNNELTAIALGPCPLAKRLCKGLPLALA